MPAITSSAGLGAGAHSLDPYLLRTVEAASSLLVARSRGGSGLRVSVVQGVRTRPQPRRRRSLGDVGEGLEDRGARYVVDDTEGADLRREDEGHAPVLGFLVAAQRFDHALRRLARTAHRKPDRVESSELAIARAGLGKAEPLGDACLSRDAEGDRLPVR